MRGIRSIWLNSCWADRKYPLVMRAIMGQLGRRAVLVAWRSIRHGTLFADNAAGAVGLEPQPILPVHRMADAEKGPRLGFDPLTTPTIGVA
jgi:hypothetical protein